MKAKPNDRKRLNARDVYKYRHGNAATEQLQPRHVCGYQDPEDSVRFVIQDEYNPEGWIDSDASVDLEAWR